MPIKSVGKLIPIKSKLDVGKLIDDLIQTMGEPFVDGSKVIMYARQGAGLPKLPEVIAEIEGITELKAIHLMVNILPVGVTVPVHRDFLPDYNGFRWPIFERWHLPLDTNPQCWIEYSGHRYHQQLMEWDGPIPYWIPHQIGNYGETNRTHLIVDLEPTNLRLRELIERFGDYDDRH